MSHPARRPIGTMGIDGKANAANRRPSRRSRRGGLSGAGRMSHAAKGVAP
jgi:hypothetical protein